MRWYSLVTLRACLREVTREEDGTMAMDFRIKTPRRRGKWNQCVRLEAAASKWNSYKTYKALGLLAASPPSDALTIEGSRG